MLALRLVHLYVCLDLLWLRPGPLAAAVAAALVPAMALLFTLAAAARCG